MATFIAGYTEVGESEWRSLATTYSHAAHAMVYAQWPGGFLDKYDYKFAVMVSKMHGYEPRGPVECSQVNCRCRCVSTVPWDFLED